jgi:prepilin-type N-terminal cleavage/methylation domain-containing protein
MGTCEKQRNNPGFTLIEIMISAFIALLLITVAFTVLHVGRKTYDYSAYSFYLTEDTYAATEWIKKDLMQTNLSTIRVFPQSDNPDEPPGISMISAFDPQDGTFKFNNYGRPMWKTHVFYTLVPSQNPDEKGLRSYKIGQLIRWEIPLSKESNVPTASTVLPSLISNIGNKRTIINKVLLPGQDVKGIRKLDKFGGFRVSFVRRERGIDEDRLSEINPANVSDTNKGILSTSGNTSLVQVDLVIQETSRETGSPNLIDLSFRVKPRN